MKITKFILCMGALLTLNLVPIRAIAGNAGIENGETVITYSGAYPFTFRQLIRV